jgi:6-phosphogluconate dehydrogenase (decarboxylating)
VAARIAIKSIGRAGCMLCRAAAYQAELELVPVSAVPYERFGSRGEGDFADKVRSALRYEFAGDEHRVDAAKGGA